MTEPIRLKFDNELQMEMELDAYMTRDVEVTFDEETGERIETEVGDKYFIGRWHSRTHGVKAQQWEIRVRGTLYADTGDVTIDAEGNEQPVREALKGWHVDLYPKLGAHPIEEWTEKGYIVYPENPQFR